MQNSQIASNEDLVRIILENDKDLAHSHLDENLLHELIDGKVSKNINEFHDDHLAFGQKVADKIAAFGGSWPFIILFGIAISGWILINTIFLIKNPFDPYPFILLNLFLSCLAAIQAPIIMMSQNRQAEKDRLTAANDYLVNLKTEIIIEDLHHKIDILTEQNNKI